MSVYDFSAETITGDVKPLSDFKGDVLLIVNTASECGYTKQYKGLQEMYERFQERSFQILGFPCNQFGAQEPDSNEAIAAFCERNYGVSFPMFAKVQVNGEDAHPLFAYLREQAPGENGVDDIKWNFTKFLVDRQGNVVKRYASGETPEQITSEIEQRYF
ncbi:glutathione peroxidase [Paenibacillus chungangensis]|uniref:Glutathione peroxidase n=1 Tax=Paenibacillus chungangensis TaxID=696535 RepID=A0ABW3HNJ7_9BACL